MRIYTLLRAAELCLSVFCLRGAASPNVTGDLGLINLADNQVCSFRFLFVNQVSIKDTGLRPSASPTLVIIAASNQVKYIARPYPNSDSFTSLGHSEAEFSSVVTAFLKRAGRRVALRDRPSIRLLFVRLRYWP
eukprot:6180545-Pleurochrysis_carterae.AAC.2